ncbi:type II CAAX endopeptidase family protein [uncultured Tyzzerella sp.]|uniref:CPBP family intramembrane glutamic endopeptidase n=1 Tax=uncultured Tyzzerella sp. TaxID=2321398 RepID=UPI002943235F|nr:type II CAAX endopeptidase family protein [uncultured Tyzzerella sp.]
MNYPKNANVFMFILMIFFIFMGNGISFLISRLYPDLLSQENIWISQSIFSTVCLVGPIILYVIVKRIKIKDVIPLKPLSIKNFFILIFIAFAIQPMLQLIGFITNIFHKDEISDVIYSFSSLGLPKALFSVAIVPAITEELAFRGVILTGYKKTGVLVAVLMSSIYFGMIHFTITQLFYTVVAGIIFAIAVKVTKSIYAGILMHFVLNGTQITMAYFLIKYQSIQSKLTGSEYNILEQAQNQLSNPIGIFIQLLAVFIQFMSSIPFLILAVFLFVRVNRKEIDTLIQENKQLKNNQDKTNIFTTFFYVNILVYLSFMVLSTILKKIYM